MLFTLADEDSDLEVVEVEEDLTLLLLVFFFKLLEFLLFIFCLLFELVLFDEDVI
jgi:hypothetical protein